MKTCQEAKSINMVLIAKFTKQANERIPVSHKRHFWISTIFTLFSFLFQKTWKLIKIKNQTEKCRLKSWVIIDYLDFCQAIRVPPPFCDMLIKSYYRLRGTYIKSCKTPGKVELSLYLLFLDSLLPIYSCIQREIPVSSVLDSNPDRTEAVIYNTK